MNEYVDRGELAVAVRDWIERGKIVGEEIRHILVQHEGSRDPVDTIRAEDVPKSADGEAADEFVEKIAKKIESDAAGYKGTLEQYYVELFTGTRERSTSRFTCSCAIDKSERRGRTERADEKGALALVMRLADNCVGRLERQNDKADSRYELSLKREENLRQECAALRAKIDELQARTEERIAKQKQDAENAAMIRELFQDAKAAVPLLLNRLAGEKVLPLSELAPEQVLLREFVRQCDTDEVKFLISALAEKKPRLGIMIAELVMKVQGEDVRRNGIREAMAKYVDEQKKKLAASDGPPVPELPKMNGAAAAKLLEQASSNGSNGSGRSGAPLTRGDFW